MSAPAHWRPLRPVQTGPLSGRCLWTQRRVYPQWRESPVRVFPRIYRQSVQQVRLPGQPLCGRGVWTRSRVRECRRETFLPVSARPPRNTPLLLSSLMTVMLQGNPYTGCIAGECDENSDCGPQRACKDYKCVDPCSLSCGQGADCTVRNHVAICRCPKGTTGDPFRNCRRFTRAEICAPCGANTDCEVRIVD